MDKKKYERYLVEVRKEWHEKAPDAYRMNEEWSEFDDNHYFNDKNGEVLEDTITITIPRYRIAMLNMDRLKILYKKIYHDEDTCDEVGTEEYRKASIDRYRSLESFIEVILSEMDIYRLTKEYGADDRSIHRIMQYLAVAKYGERPSD